MKKAILAAASWFLHHVQTERTPRRARSHGSDRFRPTFADTQCFCPGHRAFKGISQNVRPAKTVTDTAEISDTAIDSRRPEASLNSASR